MARSEILPLKYAGRVFGVLSLEFAQALEATEIGKREFASMADSIARIVWSRETRDRFRLTAPRLGRHDHRGSYRAVK